jgi:16S rRNA (adenine1518-N6/adenine1519-N6)-dimethyltransferase
MIKAKKQFGQNFLVDKSIVEKILQASPKDENLIVEIGPGLGDLTREILKLGKVEAFEIDRDLCQILTNEFKDELKRGDLKLTCGDVLEHWKEHRLVQKRYNLIANLPYNVATKIILNALNDDFCKNIVVMIQKEVALKFSATKGEKEFNSLAVLANNTSKVKLLFDVEKECFSPPPKVTSSVIKFEKFGQKKVQNLSDFENFLRVAFSSPRKKLMKNLLAKYDKNDLQSIF